MFTQPALLNVKPVYLGLNSLRLSWLKSIIYSLGAREANIPLAG
jgi:hypothetical protein